MERNFAMYGRVLNRFVRRYSNSSSEPYEDLLQVGYLGLIKAVNGYKPDSKAKSSSYAYSTIDGELKHHFRDTALVKKPRCASAKPINVQPAILHKNSARLLARG